VNPIDMQKLQNIKQINKQIFVQQTLKQTRNVTWKEQTIKQTRNEIERKTTNLFLNI